MGPGPGKGKGKTLSAPANKQLTDPLEGKRSEIDEARMDLLARFLHE